MSFENIFGHKDEWIWNCLRIKLGKYFISTFVVGNIWGFWEKETFLVVIIWNEKMIHMIHLARWNKFWKYLKEIKTYVILRIVRESFHDDTPLKVKVKLIFIINIFLWILDNETFLVYHSREFPNHAHNVNHYEPLFFGNIFMNKINSHLFDCSAKSCKNKSWDYLFCYSN